MTIKPKIVTREIKAGGKSYTLTFNFQSISEVEGDAGGSVFESMGEGMSMKLIGNMFWAALKPEHNLERSEAYALIDNIGIVKVAETVAEGFADYFGQVEPNRKVRRTAKKKAA